MQHTCPLDMLKKGAIGSARVTCAAGIRDRFLISWHAACHVGLLFLTS
jgi:hypothetical protein